MNENQTTPDMLITLLLAESEQELQDLMEQVNRNSTECYLDININNAKNYDKLQLK